jgi:Na+/melibiose symporter-like transporter
VKTSALIFYGLLGLPLAMAALPVYVQIPNYYTAHLGLPLATTGLVLFFARMFDTVQDPFIGQLVDKYGCSNRSWIIISAVLLCLTFAGLWLPPEFARNSKTMLLLWLGVMLSLAYTAHSMLNIAYLAWGSNLENRDTHDSTHDAAYHQLLGASACREAFGMIGVILASIVPSWIILQDPVQSNAQLSQYAFAFAVLVGIAVCALLMGALKPLQHRIQAVVALRMLLKNPRFTALLRIYFFNSLSVAIPASLILFFINDKIQSPEKTALFLSSYFIAGACGLPLWIKLAKRIGAQRSWQLGMLIAVLSFIGASLLGSGDDYAFLVVCIASGFALGADLALPPVLLTVIVDDKQNMGAYFGLWSLVGKFTLALAGLSLSLLALLSYQPNQVNHSNGLMALTFTYAVLPCAFKLIALFLLRHFSKSTPS